MEKMCALFVSLWLATVPIAAAAGEITDMAAEAENLLVDGDGAAALDRMNRAMELAWEAAPLIVRKAVYVDTATGYGLYAERQAGPSFKSGEPLLIYVEPLGYGYGRDGLGNLALGFDVDLAVTDQNGKTVLATKDFLSFGTPLRYKNREFYLKMTVRLNGFPPGAYTANFRLRDKYSDKSAVFELPLEFL